jgi:pimeloyl-ACP methyl ester carboxylesterase
MPMLENDFRCIAMSTVGYGESDRPETPFENIEQFADSIIGFFDAMELDKTNLYGGWTGSQMAMALAAKYPDRVEKLILEEPFNWGTPRRREVHLRLHRYFEPKSDGSHLIELWKKYGGDKPGRDLKELSRNFIDFLKVNDNDGAETVYEQMGWEGAGPNAMTLYETWEEVVNIQAETLVIHGSTSELGRSHEKFLELIPNAVGVKLPSDGNFDIHMAPDLWAQEVLAFLKK